MDVTEPSAPAVVPQQARNRPPWQVLAALVLILGTLVVAVVLAKHKQANPVAANAPLPIATVGQPGADTAACRALMPALPATLAGAARRTLEGGGSSIAAWGDSPVILRCGLESPQELTCSAGLTQVDGVSWLQLTEPGLGSTTYLAADRSVRVAVTVPDDFGSGGQTAHQAARLAAVQQISDAVMATLPHREPCRNGTLLPTDS